MARARADGALWKFVGVAPEDYRDTGGWAPGVPAPPGATRPPASPGAPRRLPPGLTGEAPSGRSEGAPEEARGLAQQVARKCTRRGPPPWAGCSTPRRFAGAGRSLRGPGGGLGCSPGATGEAAAPYPSPSRTRRAVDWGPPPGVAGGAGRGENQSAGGAVSPHGRRDGADRLPAGGQETGVRTVASPGCSEPRPLEGSGGAREAGSGARPPAGPGERRRRELGQAAVAALGA